MVAALLMIVAIAVVWWLVEHKRWGLVGRVVFWVVVAAVLLAVVKFYVPPQPGG